ncbi:hypothetical protein [Aromatoleum evansii]|uniref:hypothetical protein n=1 Tax=Aromatoleum evansii TaxID=59406 RepID=UPI00145FBE62|nr:hypothetical protein [Aromatoleum evansii]NMG32606.1 hypothetical protein [Aromatoleum evansii]
MRDEKIIETLKDGDIRVYVIDDAHWGEFRVELWINGEHRAAADYFTDDELEAMQTAEYMFAEAAK